MVKYCRVTYMATGPKTVEDLKVFKKLCKANGKSMSSIFREAILNFNATYEVKKTEVNDVGGTV